MRAESVWSRGRRDAWSWLSGPPALMLWLIVTFLSPVAAVDALDWDSEVPERAVGFLVGMDGFAIVVIVIHVIAVAPWRQWREASSIRTRFDTQVGGRPRIESVLGEVRRVGREIHAVASVYVANGPALNARGRLVSAGTLPPGSLEWARPEGGRGQVTIDTQAALHVAAVDGRNRIGIAYADHGLRDLHGLYYVLGGNRNEYIFTVEFAADNCAPLQKVFCLTVSVPQRTDNADPTPLVRFECIS